MHRKLFFPASRPNPQPPNHFRQKATACDYASYATLHVHQLPRRASSSRRYPISRNCRTHPISHQVLAQFPLMYRCANPAIYSPPAARIPQNPRQQKMLRLTAPALLAGPLSATFSVDTEWLAEFSCSLIREVVAQAARLESYSVDLHSELDFVWSKQPESLQSL